MTLHWVPSPSGGDSDTGTPSVIQIGPTVNSITAGASAVTVDMDTPWGIDADGAPYYDAAGAIESERAQLVFDRTTCAYQLLPWCAPEETSPEPAPTFYERELLTTPTYDGSGQGVHPDVVRIEGGWNGWEYWLAFTPYPFEDDSYENPSVLVSNDGFTWQVPAGGSNPLLAAPAAGQVYSDCELVFEESTGTLWLFYRLSDDNGGQTFDKLHVMASTDGVTWTSPTEILSGTFGQLLSPSVTKDGSTWKMWTVDSTVASGRLKLRTASAPTGTWSAPTTCTAEPDASWDFWHVDVVPGDTGWVALINVRPSAGGASDLRLEVGTSADGETWTFDGPVLSPSASGWDAKSLYRGSLTREATAWRCWFTGVSDANAWRIGHVYLDPNDI